MNDKDEFILVTMGDEGHFVGAYKTWDSLINNLGQAPYGRWIYYPTKKSGPPKEISTIKAGKMVDEGKTVWSIRKGDEYDGYGYKVRKTPVL